MKRKEMKRKKMKRKKMKRKKIITIIASIIVSIAILYGIVAISMFTAFATYNIARANSSTTMDDSSIVEGQAAKELAERRIVKGQIASASDFDEIGICDKLNQIVVRKNGKEGLVENGGRVIVVPQYDWISPLPCWNGLRKFINDGLYGVLDGEGNVILEPKYQSISIDEYEGTIQIVDGLTFKTYPIEELIKTE